MPIRLHMFMIQRETGEPLAICGSLMRSPTGIAGFVTALYKIAEELMPEEAQKLRTQPKSLTFHNFGHMLLALIRDNRRNLISSAFSDFRGLDDVPLLLELCDRMLSLFYETVWNRLDEAHRQLGLIPTESLESLYSAISRLLTSPRWFPLVRVSRHYVRSDAGRVLLRELMLSALRRLEAVLGEAAAKRVLDSVAKLCGLRRLDVEVALESPPEAPDEAYWRLLEDVARVFVTLVRRSQVALTSRAHENIDIVSL